MTDEMKRVLCERMADKLLVFRTMLRLSQAELADLIGVTRQTIAAMETKKRPISWNLYLTLILVLSKNYSTHQLLILYEIYTDELQQYLCVEEGDGVLVPKE